MKRATEHAMFVIERSFDFPRADVFAAWASRDAKARWFVGPDAWEKSDHALDFRVGGKESLSGGAPGGPVYFYDATYRDIVKNERIVTAYDMRIDETLISVSVATVEFKAAGKGTRVVLTEQGVFLDGHDTPAAREHGTRVLLDQLEAELRRGAHGVSSSGA